MAYHPPSALTSTTMTRRQFLWLSSMAAAGMAAGCATNPVTGKSQLMPMVAIVNPPVDYQNFLTGETVGAHEISLTSRVYAAGMMHKAYPGTGAVATGAAALLEGGVVNECLAGPGGLPETLFIGHFSGRMPVEVAGGEGKNGFALSKASIYSSARRIMEGVVYV